MQAAWRSWYSAQGPYLRWYPEVPRSKRGAATFFFSLHLTFHIIMHAPPSCSKNVGIVYEEPAKNIPKEKISTTSTDSTRTYVCACTSTTLVDVVKLHGANRQRRLRTPLSIGEPTSVRADVNDARPLTGRSPTRRASAPCPPARSPAHISGQ